MGTFKDSGESVNFFNCTGISSLISAIGSYPLFLLVSAVSNLYGTKILYYLRGSPP
jgi:hypothetical protein